ncbi:MAG: diguanylate cyclase [Roseibium sp.]|uniref:sensor domain-containing diguanylate cyclase n=1 Tax=Roseibium sp. TaxID=1936156 RepID=UPI0026086406|nr:diguanylate cyclase [Roseibium sp.]MCV0427611.1 diguanylate cyclase [Roseibium sp.]
MPIPNTGRRITVWIFGLAALLIVLSTASLTFIAHLAWREADRRALESEQLRLTNTLKDFHDLVARDQVSLSQWDASFKAVQAPLNKDFIEDELTEDLWEDLGFDRTFIVTADGMLIVQAVKNVTRFDPIQLPSGHPVRELAEQTRHAFETKQDTSNSVFADWYLPQSALLDASVSTFAEIDGIPAFLSAVPILPDEGRVALDADYPAILINAVYFNDDWILELNEQLSFKDLRFYPGKPERESPINYLVRSVDGSVFGYFRWDHAKPGREIWYTALPLIVLLATIIAIVAFAAAGKISRLSASLEESERKNHHYARHDALTGLPNRHYFSDHLAHSLEKLPEQKFAILACDLDRFKPVNDTYGHEAGDKVLCCVADRLSLLLGDTGLVSRVGGDEFLILVSKLSDKAQLDDLAKRILKVVSDPVEALAGEWVTTGISVGIAIAPDCGSNEKDLIRMADMALYQAKENGRNMYELANPRYRRPSPTHDDKELETGH